ncbi:aminotransferase-like domain-containing protein [Marinobacterium jannaschii]|uniref:aminotransferase-like domain-containing protein n=1 Tax=Marinobacterium jannaschii TaxID=64970 RepID=UPI0004897AD3|nr:PLP-dependent aminotransferase family protein [Marinobacterium jannaschii]
MNLYERVADEIASRIQDGYYASGDKLPSIRAMSQEHHVSIATVQEAYRLLEDRGLARARPKSGYYVTAPAPSPQLPGISRPAQRPLEVSQWDEVTRLLFAPHSNSRQILGRGLPDVETASLKPLQKLMSDISRNIGARGLIYDDLRGVEELRIQIARIMVDSGCRLHPDDLIVTSGCQEGLSISMRAVTKPGDVIAVDSPGFYGSMQTIRANGLKVIEIPTHPETGISIEALELALEQWPISTILVVPTYNNPLGYCMPDERKQALLKLAERYDLAIIEDDIYGDLGYSYPRPRTLKSFDTEGRVLMCSSFSKTLAPGLRVGWVAPGRFREQVLHQKYVSTAGSSSIPQLAVAEFIAQGYYERHLRKVRQQYQRARDSVIPWIENYFPSGTRMTCPQGGFLLWIELPETVDSVTLNSRVMQYQIQIAPGVIFSASGKYRNCIRLNYAFPPDDNYHAAIKRVGDIATELANHSANDQSAPGG